MIYWQGNIPLSGSTKRKYKIDEVETTIYKNPDPGIMGKANFSKFFYDVSNDDIYFWQDGNRAHHHEVWKTKLHELYPDDPDKYKAVLKKGSIMLSVHTKSYSVQVFEKENKERSLQVRNEELEKKSLERIIGEFYLSDSDLEEIQANLLKDIKKYPESTKKTPLPSIQKKKKKCAPCEKRKQKLKSWWGKLMGNGS